MTPEVLQQRADVEQAIAGRTLCDHLRDIAGQHGDAPAYSDRPALDAAWETLTWAQTRQQALELAAGYAELGLAPGERVALMMPNRVEHVLADLGAVHAAAVPVTFYATLSADQIGYMAADCDARIAVVNGAAELDRLESVLDRLPGLKKIIVRDAAACPAGERYLSWADFAARGRARLAAEPALVAGLIEKITPDDPVTLLYTSGTTGNPKGVVITHRNALYEITVAMSSGTVPDHVRWVSYLPLAHIAERMFSIYLGMSVTGHMYFCHDARTGLVATLGQVRPTAFFGVPRSGRRSRPASWACSPPRPTRTGGRRSSGPWTPAAGTSRAASSARRRRTRWPRSSARPTRACWRPSARCSGWVRRSPPPARPPRCPRRWPGGDLNYRHYCTV